ncbi:hypothetical protein [Nocardioides campestrisoli]|uniref:hypothetical protein n=1 Tax=Nocardioides campestrisoli TaxID=2736757 RepID=UPI0015E74C71|nr:hypothetical protein [Nocardioides campestrisoli]
MTTQLRDELTRLGDEAPPLHVDPGTWGRGRRARRRDRVVTAVTALVVVGSLGGAGLALTLEPSGLQVAGGPAASAQAGGVPELVVLPPTHLVQTGRRQARWDERVASDDLAVGRGAVAFEVPGSDLAGSAVPMVVGVDGRHHALELPGWQGTVPDAYVPGATRMLALSPDGTQLAYAWGTGSDDSLAAEHEEHGLRVADLRTGDVRDVAFGPGVADMISHVSWDPFGRWLAWCGGVVEAEGQRSSTELVCGRVGFGADVVEPFLWREGGLAIDVHGRVTQTEGRFTWRWNGDVAAKETELVRADAVDAVGAVAVASPDGSTALLGSEEPGQAARFLDRRTGEVTERALGKDLALYDEGAEVHPLGWIDDYLAVALVMPAGDTTYPDDAQLVVMSAPSIPEEFWTYRVVGHVDARESSAFAPRSLSVATDLMTLDEPTIATERPDWPGERGGWIPWTVGLLLLTAASAAFLLVRRRDLRRAG